MSANHISSISASPIPSRGVAVVSLSDKEAYGFAKKLGLEIVYVNLVED